jgi:hypothetical protein
MLFDEDGNRMTPTHATKKGRRYPLLCANAAATGSPAS